MNHFGNNAESPVNPHGPHGMKRRLPQDPRQRLYQNRPQNEMQMQQPQQPQQQLQPQQQGGRFPGRGGGPAQIPPTTFGRAPGPGGRGFPPSQQQQGPPRPPPHMGAPMGGRGMNGRGPRPGLMAPASRGASMMGRGPMMGPGRGGSMAGHQAIAPDRHAPVMGRSAPPPPPPQRGPFSHRAMMHNGPSHMQNSQGPMQMQHQVSQGLPVMGYGQSRVPPPPPLPRAPFAPPQHPMQHHVQPQMHHPQHAHPSPHQMGMVANIPLQHQQHHIPQRPHTNQFLGHGQTLQANPPHTGVQPLTGMMNMAQHPPQQQPSAATATTLPKNVAATYSQIQIDQAWTEYTDAKTGKKYYHNTILQTSTYNKPKTLPGSQQAQAQPQAAAAAIPETNATTVVSTTQLRPWAEYTDAGTGKKYYSNGVTTTWEKPEGFTSVESIVAQSNAQEESAAIAESAKKRRKIKVEKETPFRNNEEALAAFKGLLLAKAVVPGTKWNDVVKICSSDSRWEDCEAVLTTGERKQALAEYQTKRANELRTREREERSRAKSSFLQLLTEGLPKQSGFSVWTSRFGDIRDSISKDDRFYTVHDEATRESLFLDFCEELRKHDERKKRNQKREAQDAFNSFLKEKEETGVLSFSSTWYVELAFGCVLRLSPPHAQHLLSRSETYRNSFLAVLQEVDKNDSRFKVSSFLSDSDRQVYFADFVIELQTAEDDKRRRIRDARRRAEKAQRDAYRDSLERLASEGKLTPSSHWRDVERLIELDESYQVVQEQDRDAPREIYEEFIEAWDEVYRRDRQFLSQLVHPTSNREMLITKDTKYDEFVKSLLQEATTSPQIHTEARRITKTEEPVSSARLYFNELLVKAKDKVAVPLRRRIQSRRGSLLNDSSSEDEGEIIEDGEEGDKVEPKETVAEGKPEPQPVDDEAAEQ
jgi:pre-mRNA-processing factor 40